MLNEKYKCYCLLFSVSNARKLEIFYISFLIWRAAWQKKVAQHLWLACVARGPIIETYFFQSLWQTLSWHFKETWKFWRWTQDGNNYLHENPFCYFASKCFKNKSPQKFRDRDCFASIFVIKNFVHRKMCCIKLL